MSISLTPSTITQEQETSFETWDDLTWWNSGERQVVEERLDGEVYNPGRDRLYAALKYPYQDIKVCIMGQDPYPQSRFCTGIAFSIPASFRKYPPTLELIYKELEADLKITRKNGCLVPWCKQGVLLWNAIPTCLAGVSMSHDWNEYEYLTREIVSRLAERGVVFAFLGSVARRYTQYVETDNGKNVVIETGHPSPRGNMSSRNPFTGSRLFSTINSGLCSIGYEPINWGA